MKIFKRSVVWVLLWGLMFNLGCQKSHEGKTYVIHPGDNDQYELQNRLINAVPGDVIQLEKGIYTFNTELSVVEDNITIRGRGHEDTILSFKDQEIGSEGIRVTGNAFVIENLAVEDTVGNAIKVLGAEGVIFRGVRVEWTNGTDSDNGAYGIYPVQCSDVLIEYCIARAASDAGIYVGQSRNVIVRRNLAEMNVAGIEIENTIGADVYENVATNNTGGLLVFDLPGLEVINGRDIRVYNNRIVGNNTPNFATEGTMVAGVPTGTGLMVMATDRVEVFENEISDNDSTAISVVSFLITGRKISQSRYDPYPEGIYLYDNSYQGGGTNPKGEVATELLPHLGKPFPNIFYDGIINPDRPMSEDSPVLVIDEKEGTTFANVNLESFTQENVDAGTYQISRDIHAHSGAMSRLASIVLNPLKKLPSDLSQTANIYRSAPRLLSEWGLFKGALAEQAPVEGVLPYELNAHLFSDYTTKRRFIRLPKGQKMKYHAKDSFEFPVGTVIAKTFSYPTDMRDSGLGESLLETRIEFREASGWYGYSYIWNDEQTDADLSLGGGSLDVSWIHKDGQERALKYVVPDANQCIACHSSYKTFEPIGTTARNLNRVGKQGGENQLTLWNHLGLIDGLASDPPRMANYEDSNSGSLDDRARAWLDVNCAHCHRPGGSARSSGLHFQYGQQNMEKLGVWKSPVATGRGSGGRLYDIVPGKPEQSILMHRIESSETGVRMPNLARSIPHLEGVELIRNWILEMNPTEDF